MTRRLKALALAAAALLALLCAMGLYLAHLAPGDDSRAGLERVMAAWLTLRGAQRHEYTEGAGRPLVYWQAGAPDARVEPVLLIHGAGGDAVTAWFRLLPALAGERLVLAPQLPYADLTASSAALTNFFWEQNGVIRLMDHLGLDKVAVVGLSAGAWVASLVAMNYPQRVERLVLVSPMGLETETILGPLLAAEHPGRTFLENMFQSPPPLLPLFSETLGRPVEEALRGLSKNMDSSVLAAMDLTDRLPLIGCPTLIISGDQDRIIPASTPRGLAAGIPDARLLVLPDCGHAVVWDQPAQLEDALRRFLDGQWPREARQ